MSLPCNINTARNFTEALAEKSSRRQAALDRGRNASSIRGLGGFAHQQAAPVYTGALLAIILG